MPFRMSFLFILFPAFGSYVYSFVFLRNQYTHIRTQIQHTVVLTYTRYVIPEDGDEMAHPNIFEVNANANNISLKSLKAAFPMRGNYHFRFLTSVNVSNGNSNSNGKGVSVWMDCSDDNAVVPLQNGGVFAKVSRISSGALSSSASSATTAATPVAARGAIQQETTERRNSEKLINFDSDQKPAPINTSTPSIVENDLLGLSSTTSSSAASSSSSSSSSQPTPVSVFSTG